MNFSAHSSRPILMIEDQDVDYEITQRGLKRMGVPMPLLRFTSVDETTRFLEESRLSSGGENLPGVVILDLKLLDGDGVELLRHIKDDRVLKHIPVIVWSANTDPKTISRCYSGGASGYIRKASERALTDEALETFVRYWLHTVTLPAN